MIEHPLLERNVPETKKHRIFKIFHKIIRDYSVPNNLYIFFLIFEGLQMLFYAIHPTYLGLWPVPFLSTLQQILGFIATPNLWKFTGSIGVIIGCSLFTILLSAPLVLLSYEILSDSGKGNGRNMLITKFIGYIAILTKTIFTIPILSLTTVVIGGQSNNIVDNYEIVALFSFITFVIYILNLVIYSLFFIDNSPFSSLPFSTSLNYNETIKIILKCLMGIYGSIFSQAQFINLIYCVFLLVAIATLLFLIYLSPPFKFFPIYNIHDQILVMLCWIIFAVILQILICPQEEAGIYFTLIGCILINFFWLDVRMKRESQIIYSNYKNITEVKNLLYYNNLMISYVMKLEQTPLNIMKLEGILSEHIVCCKKSIENCICRTVKKNLNELNFDGDRSLLQKQKRQWFQYIKNDLTFASQKYRCQPEFSLLLGYIEKEIMFNNFRTLKNLEEENQLKNGLRYEFLNYHQKRIVQSKMSEEDRINNEKKAVDINKFYNFQISFGNIQNLILQSTIDHMNFWKRLKTNSKQKDKIIKEGHQIFKKVEEIQKQYDELMNINQNNIYTLILYSNYMKHILNNPQVLSKNSETIKNIKKNILKSPKISNENDKEKYGENSLTGVIIISGERKNIGIIKHCTSKVTEILNYPIHELIGQNINTIMPSFLGNMHNDVLCQYLELAQSKFDFVERLAPMINKNTFLVLSKILTKPLPSLLNGLELVGIFQTIKEYHIKHQTQTPKYVLYRSDTGKIESLSESCFQDFGYKITKINQYSETSQDLSFNDLFINIKDSEIGFNQNGYSSSIKQKFQEITHPIIIYLRHQIVYFGVKLKLLYFFNSGPSQIATLNPKKNEPTVEVYRESQLKKEEFDDLKQKGRELINPSVILNKEVGSQKPFKLKVIFIILLVFTFILVVLTTVQLVITLIHQQKINSYLQNMKISSDSIKNVLDISYYGRLMQLGALYEADLPDFSEYKSNISLITSQLQKNQFQLVNSEIQLEQLDFSFSEKPLTWRVDEQDDIVSSATNININIFDYVTSASNFNSAEKSDFNFDTVLLNNLTSSNTFHRDLFRIRYTALFQTQKAKQDYQNALKTFYVSLLQKIYQQNLWLSVSVSLFVLLVTIVLLPLIFSILSKIFQILMLFGYLSSEEIEKQIQNCFLFIKVFFTNFYTVQLEEKQKNGSPSSNLQYFEKQKITSQKLLNSLQVSSNLEEEQHDLLMNNSEVKNENQNKEEELQKIQKNQINEEELIQDELTDNYVKCEKLKIFVFVFVLMIAIISYFVGNYLYLSQKTRVNLEVADIYLDLEETIELIKISKTFSMEAGVDNSLFQSYPLLKDSSSNFVERLYKNQRIINEKASQNTNMDLVVIAQKINKENTQNVCDNTFKNGLNFDKSSFHVDQCETITKKVLKEGLRTSIVGFCETMQKISLESSAQDVLALSQFKESIKLEKYIVNVLQTLTEFVEKNLKQQLVFQNNIFIIFCCVFSLCLIIVIGIFIIKNIKELHKKIIGTTQIISLIPTRIFAKNQQLSTSYKEQFKSLMK